MTRLVSALGLVLLFVTGADAQWWKEKAGSRIDQRVVDPTGQTAGRIKWDDGYIEVQAGGTADPAIVLNPAHGRSLALAAARNEAYLKIAEIVEGVAIDGVTIVKNAMVVDQTIRSTVSARIRGAFVVREDAQVQRDGSVWAEVVLGIRLRGSGSLSDALAAAPPPRPGDAYQPDPSFRVNERYTGLIVDASDTAAIGALAPRVLDEATGKVVFAANLVDPAAFARHGFVGYAATMADALAGGRAGANPLIARATAAAGGTRADLVVSGRDSERALAADRGGNIFARAAVVIVLGKDRRELARERTGTWHALLIGIDDYPAGPDAPGALASATHDARGLAQAFRQSAGVSPASIRLVENRDATRAGIVDALRDLAARAQEPDTVVIFFSGHGARGPGRGGRPHYYLLPRDTRMSDLASTALVDEDLEELIAKVRARHVVVILDACYSGGGTQVIRARGASTPAAGPAPARGLIEASEGRVVISASRPDQLAWEDPQRGGVFTSFVIEGVGGAADLDRDGAVSVLELYQYVAPRVRAYARDHHSQDQTPVLEVRGLSGEIVVARRR